MAFLADLRVLRAFLLAFLPALRVALFTFRAAFFSFRAAFFNFRAAFLPALLPFRAAFLPFWAAFFLAGFLAALAFGFAAGAAQVQACKTAPREKVAVSARAYRKACRPPS